MKVQMTAESKRILTLAEAPIASRMIKEMKEDESSAAEYIRYAISAAGERTETVFEATASIAKNRRIWDGYGKDTGDLDIWIDATARTANGFIIIGAYLTDIWNISGDNCKEVASHMYIRRFAEAN